MASTVRLPVPRAPPFPATAPLPGADDGDVPVTRLLVLLRPATPHPGRGTIELHHHIRVRRWQRLQAEAVIKGQELLRAA